MLKTYQDDKKRNLRSTPLFKAAKKKKDSCESCGRGCTAGGNCHDNDDQKVLHRDLGNIPRETAETLTRSNILTLEEIRSAIDNKVSLEMWYDEPFYKWMPICETSISILTLLFHSGFIFRMNPNTYEYKISKTAEAVSNGGCAYIGNVSTGKKFEYAVDDFETTDPNNTFESSLKILNKMGANGWEVCLGVRYKDKIQYLLKREIK